MQTLKHALRPTNTETARKMFGHVPYMYTPSHFHWFLIIRRTYRVSQRSGVLPHIFTGFLLFGAHIVFHNGHGLAGGTLCGRLIQKLRVKCSVMYLICTLPHIFTGFLLFGAHIVFHNGQGVIKGADYA